MKRLTAHDVEVIKLAAGYGEDEVTLDREDFEALIIGYSPHLPAPISISRHNELEKLKRQIVNLEAMLAEKRARA